MIKKNNNFFNLNLIERLVGSEKNLIKIYIIKKTNSTQTLTKRYLNELKKKSAVVLARDQTQGYGQYGRIWHSKGNSSVQISLGFQGCFASELIQKILPWLSIDLCRMIYSTYGFTPYIKWPNDLLLNGKKFSGLIAELQNINTFKRNIVVGIGMNVNTELSHNFTYSFSTTISKYINQYIDINTLTSRIINTSIDSHHSLNNCNNQIFINTS